MNLVVDSGGTLVPSEPLSAALALGDEDGAEPAPRSGAVEWNDERIPASAGIGMLIGFYGADDPRGAFEVLAAEDLLKPGTRISDLADRVVVVGDAGQDVGADLRTPSGTPISITLLLATSLSNLMQDDNIARPAWFALIEKLLLIGIGVGEVTVPEPLSKLAVDPLVFYLRGADELPAMIYEQIVGRRVGVAIQAPEQRGKTLAMLPRSTVRRVGFSEDEALLPPSPRSFEGYRLLREYFAFPQRYLFIGVDGLRGSLKQCTGSQFDLLVLLNEADVRLENRVNASCFELFCTPAINLFPKTLDRISLSERFSEFHVIADHNRPLDFEIFEVQGVTGYGTEAGQEQEVAYLELSH